MLESDDAQWDDYDDGQPNPGSEHARPAAPAGKPRPSPLRLGLQVGLVFAVVGLFMGGAIGVTERTKEAANRSQSKNNLLQIGLAIQNYHDSHGELPKNTYTADGRPLLSWRVHLLPYLEHDKVYRLFKPDEPWDGPTNLGLLTAMPAVYAGPGRQAPWSGETYYRGFSNPGAVFERRPGDHLPKPDGSYPPFGFASLIDGAANTILVVEAGNPVEWTKPDDLDASPAKPFPKMGGLGWRKGFLALLADGSVRLFRPDCPEQTLRALITHSGGEPLPPGWAEKP
jgi:type II secretory pathway pseudopilin PulG